MKEDGKQSNLLHTLLFLSAFIGIILKIITILARYCAMSEGKKVLTGKADMYGGMIIDTRRDQSLATISDSDFDEILKGKMV